VRTLQLRLSGEFKRFADEELWAVLTLLAGPMVVWELAFGIWRLLQPERINARMQERFNVMSVRRWRVKALGQAVQNLVV
jgi:hypothetical protein